MKLDFLTYSLLEWEACANIKSCFIFVLVLSPLETLEIIHKYIKNTIFFWYFFHDDNKQILCVYFLYIVKIFIRRGL